MTGFVIMILWFVPAAFIIGAVKDSGGQFGDVGCVAFIPLLNIVIAFAILANGGRV